MLAAADPSLLGIPRVPGTPDPEDWRPPDARHEAAWRSLRTPRFAPLAMTATNRTVSGFNLVYLWDRAGQLGAALDELLEMVRDDRIHPVIGATYPYEQVGEAHTLLQSRGSIGKVVLVRDREPGSS